MNDAPPPRHPAIDAFPVADSCLLVGGIPLTRLATRVGSTPFFAYDRRLLTERVHYLRSCLPESVALHYAIKANPMPAVIQHLADLVDGFDIASALELKEALDTPIPPSRISFAGPGKTDAELMQAIAADVTLEAESAGELKRIAEHATRQGRRPRVAIRVNPNFAMKGSGMRMGGGAQQFGVDAEQVPLLLSEFPAMGLEFVGFHIFSGSQILREDSLLDLQEKTIKLALSLGRDAPNPVRHVNIGGGFGIPYFPADRSLSLSPIGENLARLIQREVAPNLPEARVIIELGRYLVGEAGIYVTRIIDRKESRGRTFLVTDGGLHHQLAASGNFGQVIRRNYPIAVGNRMDEPASEIVNVVGCLCTPLDLLGDKVWLPRAEVGDLVVVFQSGAYGLTASPTAFLSHPSPLEVLV